MDDIVLLLRLWTTKLLFDGTLVKGLVFFVENEITMHFLSLFFVDIMIN